jgi:hypothetical protein
MGAAMIIAVISFINSIAALAMMISTARLRSKLFRLWLGAYIFYVATVVLYFLMDKDEIIIFFFVSSFSAAIVFQLLSLKSERNNKLTVSAIVFSTIYTAVVLVSYLHFY